MGTFDVGMEAMVAQLRRIRETQGTKAFQEACKNIARQVILKPNGHEYIKRVLEPLDPDLNLDELRAEAEERAQVDPQRALIEALSTQVPNLKTQAQFNVFMTAFDAFRLTINNAFGGDKAGVEKGKVALAQAMEAALQSKDIAEKLEEVPEAAESDEAKQHKEPPKQVMEYDVKKQLLMELEDIRSLDKLTEWYNASKERLDSVVSQDLRNELFDAIREKRAALKDAN